MALARGKWVLAEALLPMLPFAVTVGGRVGPIAGGIKIDRVAALLRIIMLALARLRAPRRAMLTLREKGTLLRGRGIAGLVAVTPAYAVSLFAVWPILLRSGVPRMPALFKNVSALSTVSLPTSMTGLTRPPTSSPR